MVRQIDKQYAAMIAAIPQPTGETNLSVQVTGFKFSTRMSSISVHRVFHDCS
jgi:hypothetical protein